MTDYQVYIGGSTTLMIRDTGGNVEFWVKTGPQTYNNQQTWSYGANGGNSAVLQYRMVRGGNWQMFGSVYVGYDQDVRFTIYNTGVGFPTYDFVQHIQRSTVPQPPTMRSVTPTSTSSFHVVFTGNSDGGSPILEWQIGYGINSGTPNSTVGSGGTSDVGGFSTGQKVYFWARGRNAIGWSAWSNRLEGTTWKVPDAPNPPSASLVTQVSMRTQFTDQGNGGQPILERQLGYGKNLAGPTSYAGDIGGTNVLTGLDPGKKYYLWARSRNSVGWGPWSARTDVLLAAGAQVLVGVQWKRAVPYMKVGGTWKVVQPWVKFQGEWKTTT